ncbi:MAG: DoxX family protein [Verrucomicrobiaceae bacterium]
MLEYTGGSPAADRNPWASLFQSVALLRIGAGLMLLTRHGFNSAVNAYHFLWHEKPWDWVPAFHEAGMPYPHLIAPLVALIVTAVAACWVLGFLTRLFAVIFTPVIVTVLVLAYKTGASSLQVEAAWLYLFITITLLLYGSGAVSIDQLFRLGEHRSHKHH